MANGIGWDGTFIWARSSSMETALSTTDRDFLTETAERIKTRSARTIVENGLDLIQAKERVGHGHFRTWVESSLPWSMRTAQRMMQAAKLSLEPAKNDILSLLPGDNLSEATERIRAELASIRETMAELVNLGAMDEDTTLDDFVGMVAEGMPDVSDLATEMVKRVAAPYMEGETCQQN
ncbi:MAG: DUF3102 domain-containing protein [Deltaproteobacteria bacterium]|nr:DUF3102 domain-containing protein [Deltaproteobacteria bacterium]